MRAVSILQSLIEDNKAKRELRGVIFESIPHPSDSYRFQEFWDYLLFGDDALGLQMIGRLLFPIFTATPAVAIVRQNLVEFFYGLANNPQAPLSTYGEPVDNFEQWATIANSLLAPLSSEQRAIATELLQYEIPYGLSPETDVTSLQALLRLSKDLQGVPARHAISFIPLIRAAWQFPELAAQQGSLVAIEHTLAATGATIIIASGFSIVDRILPKVRAGRRHEAAPKTEQEEKI